jgi:hypothetical protein
LAEHRFCKPDVAGSIPAAGFLSNLPDTNEVGEVVGRFDFERSNRRPGAGDCRKTQTGLTVAPAKAGAQWFKRRIHHWIPAFAGMTTLMLRFQIVFDRKSTVSHAGTQWLVRICAREPLDPGLRREDGSPRRIKLTHYRRWTSVANIRESR